MGDWGIPATSAPTGAGRRYCSVACVHGKGTEIDDVIERARRAQETRIDAIRVLAEARQSVADIHDQTSRELAELQARIAQQVGDAELEDAKAYNAAVGELGSLDRLSTWSSGDNQLTTAASIASPP